MNRVRTGHIHALGTIWAQNGVVQAATGPNCLGRLGRATRTLSTYETAGEEHETPCSEGVPMERTTGFEPATLTLAR
jgi:hypothetical protein